MDIHEAKEMIDTKDVTLIDIRDADSYEAGHIQDAIAVSQDNLEEFLKTASKDKPLICYCYHGFTSQTVADYLREQGFAEVHSMDGGYEAWKLEFGD
tara:strand:+ start:239 stop:529 length:291 start_codon:yes stop_codon:yes gene_type:complete